jgi:hypothetical protein
MQAPGLCPEKNFYQFLKHNPVFNIGKMGLGPCACSRCWLLMLMKKYYVNLGSTGARMAFQLPPQQLGMWTY